MIHTQFSSRTLFSPVPDEITPGASGYACVTAPLSRVAGTPDNATPGLAVNLDSLLDDDRIPVQMLRADRVLAERVASIVATNLSEHLKVCSATEAEVKVNRILAALGVSIGEGSEVTDTVDIAAATAVLDPYIDAPRGFQDHCKGRAVKIVDAINDELGSLPKGKFLDWGCGAALVMAEIDRRFGSSLAVEGVDVSVYPDPSVRLPVHKFDGYNVPASAGKYSGLLFSFVLHHVGDPDKAIKIAADLMQPGGKVIVVELLPDIENGNTVGFNRKLNHVIDWIFCRLWQRDAKIPMPGNYRTTQEWVSAFAKAGLFLENQPKEIGGTPLIHGGRKVFVFGKPE